VGAPIIALQVLKIWTHFPSATSGHGKFPNTIERFIVPFKEKQRSKFNNGACAAACQTDKKMRLTVRQSDKKKNIQVKVQVNKIWHTFYAYCHEIVCSIKN